MRRDIAAWHETRGTGLPPDATRGEVAEAMGWKERGGDGRIGGLFERVGLTPFWDSQEADTMDSHRLAWLNGPPAIKVWSNNPRTLSDK